jgi:hypothetical protein
VGGCRISTAITDVKFGHWGANGEPHETCAIFLRFEFTQPRNERLRDVRITLSFLPTAQPALANRYLKYDWLPFSQRTIPSLPPMRILHREPAHWSGPIVTQDITVSQAFGLQPSAGGMVAHAGMERTTQHRISAVAKLYSILDSRNILTYELLENNVERGGLPIWVFPCCVVVRTGGRRLSMGVKFDAGV